MDELNQIIIEAMPIATQCWDENYRVLSCNEGAVRLFGLSSKQEYLERFFELSPKYQPNGKLSEELSHKRIKRAFEKGSLRFEWMHANLKGELIPTEVSLVRTHYRDNPIVIAYITDLRAVKAAQAKMREAEIANKSKNDFLAKMSHEIRTPMNAIIGMSELILREKITPLIREHATVIKQSGASLLSIINDILDFSKIESGKMEIVQSEYFFSSLINDVISIIRMRIIEQPLLFTVNIDSKIPNKLIGDEVRLRQILLNLLGNSIKYTEKGFISISLNGKIKGDTILLTIEISDSGIGIKEEDLGKLFENFVQFDMLRHKGIEGAGLGLPIAQNLCQAMGGDITVRSKYGEGSTFTVTLPQKIAAPQRLAKVTSTGKKVLLYEPRDIYARSVASTIANLGADYKAVSKQSDFYNELQNNEYNFVFIASFLWNDSGDIVENVGTNVNWVLLADFGEEVLPTSGARKITMPAYAVPIANVLNGVLDDANYNDNRQTIRTQFVAPTAKILLVDDIRTNLMVAEGLMAPYKMQIDTCLSGREAIRLVKENKYDIVFMDHMMPQMDGVEATHIIRTQEDGSGYYKNVPIIALTANAVVGVKEMFLQNGMNDFLPKPIESLKLNSILKKWIPKKKRKKREKNGEKDTLPDIKISGVNVKDGIVMTGGSFENYLKTLVFFHNDALKKITEIRDCLQKNNIRLYTVYVHAIKSAAASIGAPEISEFAKNLEAAGNRKDIIFIMENNEIFLNELEILLSNIKSATAKYQIKTADHNADLSALKVNLLNLKAAFNDMNIREIDNTLNEIGEKKWDKKISDAIDSIAQNALLLEYDEALKTIDDLLDIF